MNRPAHYQTLELDRVRELFGRFARSSQKPLRVLDFGCGRGRYLEVLASSGCEVCGADSSDDYVTDARRRGFEAYTPAALFDTARTFDVVFLSHVIEHLTPGELIDLVPRLCGLVDEGGRLVIVTPTPGERFWHDFSHVRPYLPQSVRHAFGQTGASLSFGERRLIELTDVYFFKDPYRTRLWRSFYTGGALKRGTTGALNALFDLLWRASAGRIGVTASWLGVYALVRDEDTVARRLGPSC